MANVGTEQMGSITGGGGVKEKDVNNILATASPSKIRGVHFRFFTKKSAKKEIIAFASKVTDYDKTWRKNSGLVKNIGDRIRWLKPENIKALADELKGMQPENKRGVQLAFASAYCNARNPKTKEALLKALDTVGCPADRLIQLAPKEPIGHVVKAEELIKDPIWNAGHMNDDTINTKLAEIASSYYDAARKSSGETAWLYNLMGQLVTSGKQGKWGEFGETKNKIDKGVTEIGEKDPDLAARFRISLQSLLDIIDSKKRSKGST